MAEMISKWEVVGNLIALENEYQFHKKEWDTQTMYRRICELEMAIGKRTALDVVRCKDCTQYNGHRYCNYFAQAVLDDDFCSYGERKRRWCMNA